MDNSTLFVFAATIGRRAGLASIETQVDEKTIVIARSLTSDESDLATAMILVARGYANGIFESKADCRCFAVLAGRLLYNHHRGDKPTIDDVHFECQTHMYHLMVPTVIQQRAHRWVSSMLFNPLVVG